MTLAVGMLLAAGCAPALSSSGDGGPGATDPAPGAAGPTTHVPDPVPDPGPTTPTPGGSGVTWSGALVFLWHRAGVPHEPGSMVPSTPWGDGWYESADPRTAAWHVQLIEDAGANLMLLSWWGTGDDGFTRHIDRAADVHVAAAEEAGLAWAVFWEATSQRTLEADLARIEAWTASPTYLHGSDGSPVLFLYNRVWRELTDEQLGALAAEHTLYLEKFPRIAEIPAGEGWTYWDVPWTSEEALAARYAEVAARPDLSWAAFIMAGIDNSAIRATDGRPATVWPPDGPSADWLVRQAEAVLPWGPDMVITPLNELGEHSAVEPTVEQGTTVWEAWRDINASILGSP